MTFEDFKLKDLFEQVRNDFIREAGERLQARLAREAKEKTRREAEENAHVEEEQRAREAAEKAIARDAEAEAKAKVDAEEATHIVTEEAAKARNDTLTQGEKSHYDSTSLVLMALEEL